jgi:PhnB protein
MQSIVPYLTVASASDASAFYKKAFGATENARMAPDDRGRIAHIDLTIHGGTIFLMDQFAERGSPLPPNAERRSPVSMVIQLPAPKDVDTVYAQAINAGCTNNMEPADMFWGARFAAVTDPFGHSWMLNAMLPQKS